MLKHSSDKRAMCLIAWILYGILLIRSAQLGDSIYTMESDHVEMKGPPRLFVTGAVQHPGDYELAFPSTVLDAVHAAGGPTGDADLSRLNLKAELLHETVLRVPSFTYGFRPVISLNRSTARELTSIPGIGPKLADRIVRYRQENGGFKDEADLLKVHGIGTKKFRLILDHAIFDE